ncbi:hypothetical protein F8154_04555 [Alkaliphilus pronyensis]|uniref:Uncharacterized protein n=1 Tax=Alkaliphilus pronyensis TaxID=1482732 RepID=A0A6I0F232_9FIRM|nr:hypothetical protein [Alkaliphilus pronyensis]KAB3536037.1 hypothetical protein F8154_04555 [Alkaliphilus pronyensis]
MNYLTKDLLTSLIKENYNEKCVSIFIPTAQVGKEASVGSISLKNLLDIAKIELQKDGFSSKKAHQFLRSAYDLVDNSMFWSYQKEGLWIFITSEEIDYYRLPIGFKQLVILSKGLYIQPLLKFFVADTDFYILALSQQKIRLIHCTKYSSKEINNDINNKWESVYQSNGIDCEDSKKGICKFLQHVSSSLLKYIDVKDAPIILAGVDYILSIFKELQPQINIHKKVILGNSDDLSVDELHGKGLELLEAYFNKPIHKAQEEYKHKSESKQVCNCIEKAISSAYNGRIKTLLVTAGVRQWGTYKPYSNDIILYEDRKPNSIDLINFAATHTFLNGGKVYEVNHGKALDSYCYGILKY